jgi:hypothetical protein
LALFSLNVAWNAQHHWVTFDKQFGRLTPHGLRPQYLAELLATQVLLLNPLIATFALRGAGAGWRAPDAPGQPDTRMLLATSAPFCGYLALHALHDRVQAHWPAPVYPALVLIAAAAAAVIPEGGLLATLRRWAAPVGLGLSALVLVHIALPITDIAGLNDPTGAIRGWPVFAHTVDQTRQTKGAAWIGTLSYGVTAQLDAAGVSAPVVEIGERDRYLTGDASWRADLTRPGLIVDLSRRFTPSQLSTCFAEVTPLGELIRHQGNSRRDRYALFLVARPTRDVLAKGCTGAVSHAGL